MNKIESGCLAIVSVPYSRLRFTTKKYNTGTVVRVGNFIGKTKGINDDKLWEVDKMMSYSNNRFYPLCPERFLVRIDNSNDQSMFNEFKTENATV